MKSVDEDRIISLTRALISLQVVVEAQGELISRLLAIVAVSEAGSTHGLAAVRSAEESVAYAAALIPDDEASDGLLAILVGKADAKRSIFELAERILAAPQH